MNSFSRNILHTICIVMFLSSCASMQFGVASNDLDQPEQTITELASSLRIPYKAFVGGVFAQGEKVELLGTAQCGNRMVAVINFPYFAILSSEDMENWDYQLFPTSYFRASKKHDDKKNQTKEMVHVYADSYNSTYALAVGPFVFLSNDALNWERTQVFRGASIAIRKMFFDRKGTLHLITDKYYARYCSDSRKWERKRLKIEGNKFAFYTIVDARVCNDQLFVSLFDSQANEYQAKAAKAQVCTGVYFVEDGKASLVLEGAKGLFVKEDSSSDRLFAYSLFPQFVQETNVIERIEKSSLARDGELLGMNQEINALLQAFTNEVDEAFAIREVEQIVPAINIHDDINLEEFQIALRVARSQVLSHPFFVSYRKLGFWADYNFERLMHSLNAQHWAGLYHASEGGEFVVQPTADFLKTAYRAMMSALYERAQKPRLLQHSIKSLPLDYSSFSVQLPCDIVGLDEQQKLALENKLIEEHDKFSNAYWERELERKKEFVLEFRIGEEQKVNFWGYPSAIHHNAHCVFVEYCFFNGENYYKDLYKISLDERNDMNVF